MKQSLSTTFRHLSHAPPLSSLSSSAVPSKEGSSTPTVQTGQSLPNMMREGPKAAMTMASQGLMDSKMSLAEEVWREGDISEKAPESFLEEDSGLDGQGQVKDSGCKGGRLRIASDNSVVYVHIDVICFGKGVDGGSPGDEARVGWVEHSEVWFAEMVCLGKGRPC